MDPLVRRFAAGPRGRVAAIAAAAVAALVLTAAVLVAAFVAGGTEADLPAVAVRPAATPTPTPLLVQVGGAVRRPGLVSVPAGARVIDAVAAAGGPTKQADQDGINLAAPVADGQQVIVPEQGETGGAAPPAGAAAPSTVALNTATAEQLDTLPRIGPALAARILAYRDANGPFTSVDDLGDVPGIGPATLDGLRDLVTL